MLALLNLEDISDFAALSLLALIQGLTEFLPVSSSGHLVLAQSAMKLEEPPLAIGIALHLGTLLSVLVVYRKAVLELIRSAIALRWRELVPIVVGTVPAAVIGLTFKDELQSAFNEPDYAASGLIITSVILVIGELARRRQVARGELDSSRKLTWRLALVIGLAQAFAIWPGISRSGSTIACGLALGLSPKEAARFSFLLSIPTIAGAAILGLPEAMAEGGLADQRGLLLWSTLFAGFVGWGALRVLIAFLGRGAFAWFAVYCVIFGAGYLAFA